MKKKVQEADWSLRRLLLLGMVCVGVLLYGGTAYAASSPWGPPVAAEFCEGMEEQQIATQARMIHAEAEGTTITLTGDVSDKGSIVFEGGEWTLCLKGHTIAKEENTVADSGEPAIILRGDAKLTVLGENGSVLGSTGYVETMAFNKLEGEETTEEIKLHYAGWIWLDTRYVRLRQGNPAISVEKGTLLVRDTTLIGGDGANTDCLARDDYTPSRRHVGPGGFGIELLDGIVRMEDSSVWGGKSDYPLQGDDYTRESASAAIVVEKGFLSGNEGNHVEGGMMYCTESRQYKGMCLYAPEGSDFVYVGKEISNRIEGSGLLGENGSWTMEGNVTIPENTEITVKEGEKLTVPKGQWLLVNGNITVEKGGTLEALGVVTGMGQISPKRDWSYSVLPNAPEIEKVGADTIRVKEIICGEYSKDGGRTWQSEPVFSGLEEATAYTFCTRYKATKLCQKPSGVSETVTRYTAYSAPKEGEGYTLSYQDAVIITIEEGYEIDTDIGFSGTSYPSGRAVYPGCEYFVRKCANDPIPASASTKFKVFCKEHDFDALPVSFQDDSYHIYTCGVCGELQELHSFDENGLCKCGVRNVTYLDEAGVARKHLCMPLNSIDTTWRWNRYTWYVAEGEVTINKRILVEGAVSLILADNCKLTVSGGIKVPPEEGFTVYAQSEGEQKGSLSAGSLGSYGAGIGGGDKDVGNSNDIMSSINGILALKRNAGSITINGGKIQAYGGYNSAGIGGGEEGSGGNIVINGGSLIVTGGTWGAAIGGGKKSDAGNITINGGTIKASGGLAMGGTGNSTSVTANVIANNSNAVRVTNTMISNYQRDYTHLFPGFGSGSGSGSDSDDDNNWIPGLFPGTGGSDSVSDSDLSTDTESGVTPSIPDYSNWATTAAIGPGYGGGGGMVTINGGTIAAESMGATDYSFAFSIEPVLSDAVNWKLKNRGSNGEVQLEWTQFRDDYSICTREKYIQLEACDKHEPYEDTCTCKWCGAEKHTYQGNGICFVCGKQGDNSDQFSAASLTLTDGILINYYLLLSDATREDAEAYLHLTSQQGIDRKIKLSEGIEDKGRYRFSLKLRPDQMAEEIVAQLVYGDGTRSSSISYSVQKYAQAQENTTEESVKRLISAMLDYGTAAQQYTQNNIENPANGGKAFDAAQIQIPDTYAVTAIPGAEGVSAKGARLLVADLTTIKLRYELEQDKVIEDYTFTCDGEAIQPVKEGDSYCIYIRNIIPTQLDKMYEITVTDAAGRKASLHYSVLTYIKTVLENEQGLYEKEKDMMKTLYHYYEAAEAYVAAQGGEA